VKLWLLRPVGYEEYGHWEAGLWNPWYDKVFGFVVRAETEREARAYAQANGREELTEGVGWDTRPRPENPAWTDPKHSTCTLLTAEGKPGVVLCDYRSA
jgi:hypothetical protein